MSIYIDTIYTHVNTESNIYHSEFLNNAKQELFQPTLFLSKVDAAAAWVVCSLESRVGGRRGGRQKFIDACMCLGTAARVFKVLDDIARGARFCTCLFEYLRV